MTLAKLDTQIIIRNNRKNTHISASNPFILLRIIDNIFDIHIIFLVCDCFQPQNLLIFVL
ncbi:hypothetical protein Hanom_Chr16g01442991 [Helianthus anomalus]